MPFLPLLTPDLPAWMADAQPASFRGAGFYWVSWQASGGRRLATHEFTLRDDAYTEDLGRQVRKWKMRGFVIGDFYLDERDALISAIEDYDTPGLLVHPTQGQIICRAGLLNYSETIEDGGYCTFDLEFIQDWPQPGPFSAADPASALVGGVVSLLPIIAAAYQAVELAIVSPYSLLADAGSAMSGLPATTTAGLTASIAAVSAAPTDQAATVAAVQAVASGMAMNVIAAANVAPLTDDPVAGQPMVLAQSLDPSGGLAGLATWGNALPPVGGVGTQADAQAAQQAAVVALVQGSAVAAMAEVYASVTWPTVNAAAAARAQLLTLLDAQVQAASAAGQDQLYLAWQALITLSMRMMIQAAQNLPSLVDYAFNVPLPGVVLAQRLYRDPTRAAELEDMNDAIDPLFMPPAGVALSA